MKKRAVVIGVLLGLAVSGRRLLRAARRGGESDDAQAATGQRATTGAAGYPPGGEAVTGFAERSSVGEAQQRAPGVPPVEEADSLLMGGSAASEGAADLAGASAYSTDRAPYDADVSNEGVTLTYHDQTDRDGDVPLDEGIPNLGAPVEIGDTGPETLSEEATVDEVEDDVPEEFGEDEPIDSVENRGPWVADAPGEEDEMPAASRGLREYGEGDDDERDIEDTDDTDMIGLYEDVEPSGAGGELDLENDEAPQDADEGFSIVDDPDEPLSADAGGPIEPLSPEETLGLRDSESDNAPGNDAAAGDESNLGLTGDFDEATATQRIGAAPGEADTGGDQRSAFVTGERGSDSLDTSGADRAVTDHAYGETGAFGAPGVKSAGDVAEHAGPDTGKEPEDEEHLGVSGDFEEAEETETVPAEPIDRGDQEEQGDESSAPTDEGGPQHASGSGAGYAAAWSTPAGVVGERPDPSGGPEGATPEGGRDVGGATPDPSDSTAGESAGESGQITSQANERAGIDTSTPQDPESPDQRSGTSREYPRDPAGGDAADLAAASAADIGTSTAPERGEATTDSAAQTVFPDEVPAATQELGGRGPVNPASGGAEDPATSNVPESKREDAPRKSRKQRRMESMDWVPAGAVKGDGTPSCPSEYPIKGNANSRIYHRPSDPSYATTIPEYCFASEEDAKRAGFRAPKG